MTSISAPTPHKLSFPIPSPLRPPSSSHHQFSKLSDFPANISCRQSSSSSSSSSSSDSSSQWRWDATIDDAISTVVNCFNHFLSLCLKNRSGDLSIDADSPVKPQDNNPECNWDRWKQHFTKVEEQERSTSILKFFLLSITAVDEVATFCFGELRLGFDLCLIQSMSKSCEKLSLALEPCISNVVRSYATTASSGVPHILWSLALANGLH